MNSCERFELLISLSLDGEAAAEEQNELNRHLETCPGCRAYYADMQRIRQALVREDTAAPEGFSQRLMDRVRQTAQDPVQTEIRKILPFPRWRRWAALAACCALAVMAVWATRGSGGRDAAVSADSVLQVESKEGLDTRSIGGTPNPRDAGSADEDSAETDLPANDAAEPAAASVEEAPQPLPDEYTATVKSAPEANGGDLQPVAAAPTGSVPETAGETETERLDERDKMEIPVPAESVTDMAQSTDGMAVNAALPEEPESAQADSAEILGLPAPGIVTAFGSAAQNWVEDVLGLPWAGGGCYPLTPDQYGDLLRTLDEAGEPYRVDPGESYCLLTE